MAARTSHSLRSPQQSLPGPSEKVENLGYIRTALMWIKNWIAKIFAWLFRREWNQPESKTAQESLRGRVSLKSPEDRGLVLLPLLGKCPSIVQNSILEQIGRKYCLGKAGWLEFLYEKLGLDHAVYRKLGLDYAMLQPAVLNEFIGPLANADQLTKNPVELIDLEGPAAT